MIFNTYFFNKKLYDYNLSCDVPLEPCDLMKCLNGGKCQVGLKNIPYCECPDKRFTGTQCEKGKIKDWNHI